MAVPPMPPDDNRGPAINAVIWICVAISTLFTFARILTRIYISRNSGVGDILVAFSWITFTINVAITSNAVKHGLGRHIEYLQPDDITKILYLNAIFQPIGTFSYVIPKFAVVLLIVKLVGPKRNGIWFLYFLLLVLFISSALPIIFIFAQCNPPSHFWHPFSPATCWSPNILKDTQLFGGAWSAFVDLCLAAFPITVFWNLQMKTGRKIGVSILMGLGIFAMICAIVKTSNLPNDEKADFTWDVYGLVVWANIEIAVVIVCACIPTLPQLALLLLGKRQKATYNPPERPTKPSYPGDTTGPRSTSSYNKILEDGTPLNGEILDSVQLRTIGNSTTRSSNEGLGSITVDSGRYV